MCREKEIIYRRKTGQFFYHFLNISHGKGILSLINLYYFRRKHLKNMQMFSYFRYYLLFQVYFTIPNFQEFHYTLMDSQNGEILCLNPSVWNSLQWKSEFIGHQALPLADGFKLKAILDS